ncbi:MAG: YdeI/OmpD-associated family protein [Terracidiphilus sp.]|jgi:uncharacterized protein YdeI (YjbR/CyaY-like superfamily)
MAEKKTGAMRKTFTAMLEPDGTALKWTIARIPFDVAKVWPGRKGRRVRGEIEGFPFRTTLVSYPRGKGAVLIVNRQMRAAVHVREGEKARIWLEPDLDEREVLLQADLKRELNSDCALRKWYDALSDSMRREIGKWVDEPKSPESRKKRATKMAERLMQAMEGELEPPPVLKAIFQRQPRAREAWFALTPVQRRNHLLGIFYYETVEGRERRAAKAIESALEKAGNS